MDRVRTSVGDLEDRVRDRLAAMARDRWVERAWARDHTLWRSDPAEIVDRLGWLDAPESSRAEVEAIRALVNEVRGAGLVHTVLLGMGGSSLAPEVLQASFGRTSPFELTVLDTTHPDALARAERRLPLDRTLFVVSSKSGTTIETLSHLAHFHALVGEGSRFVAVTDPGSPLEKAAADLGFRGVFQAPPDVGGRYAALTVFGLVPAALAGIDPALLLDGGAAAAEACGPGVAPAENPAALLGATMGEAALAGRDKLTFALPPGLGPLGAWAEQLVAESTGKEGTGIVPVDGEPLGPREVYGDDRLFLTAPGVEAPGPFVELPLRAPRDLGWAFFVLELATALAGAALGIHPFDQPDVQAAKDRTGEVLASGDVPEEPLERAADLLGTVRPGDYVAIQAFVDPGGALAGPLRRTQARIRDRLKVASTLGFGPRYLHSTGQLHKGGPDTGVFLQVFEEPREDRPVPGQPYTFGRLVASQAAGDLAALRDRGRRAARVAPEDLLSWEG